MTEVRFEARGATAQMLQSRDPEVLMSGPAGTGKSMGCLFKIHLIASKYPGTRLLLVRKTLSSLTSTGLETWRERVVGPLLANGSVIYFGGSATQPAQYKYPNGSRVLVGGMDRATKIMSSDYDVVFVQEATELTTDDWESLTTRLRHGAMPYQQIIADCNPSAPHHWLKARVDRGQTVMLESRHQDNPALFVRQRGGGLIPTSLGKAYLDKLSKLTGVRKLRLEKGLWAAAEGLVYDNWDPAVHLVDRFDPPQDWPRRWSVDFGFTNPMVVLFWAIDPDGRAWLYRQLYHTRRLVEDMARQALSTCRRPADGVASPDPDNPRHWVWTEPIPTAVVCDHDAEGRATLERYLGLSTVPADKRKTEGIQAVQKRLEPAGDGKHRLYIMRDSLVERDPDLAEQLKPCSTDEEIVGYVWDVGEGKPPKETPVDRDNHGMDATRYLVADLDLRSRPRVRFM